MEIWVDVRNGELPVISEGIDRLWVEKPIQDNEFSVQEALVHGPSSILGGYFVVVDETSQNNCKAAIGSADWLLIECETWSMIPLENLIAARQGSATKIAAIITTPQQAQGAGFALEQGVDALVVSNSKELIEAALITKSQRHETEVKTVDDGKGQAGTYELGSFSIHSVEDGGIGDRYCLDFTSLLGLGEGVLVGSSSSQMLLIHSETIPSSFVPTRPFRVNAGAPHSYILMADGTTKYMSELKSGNEIMILHESGCSRLATLGRIKIEQRPMLKINFQTLAHNRQKPNEGHVFMQQAETVRLVGQHGTRHSVTDLPQNTVVIGWFGGVGRHVGSAIESRVEER
jgi:3-dehydroquinate synthase II